MEQPRLLSWIVTSFLLLLGGTEMGFAQTNFWQQTNGPNGGYIETLAINSSGHIFAGTYGDGVFRSTDNGNSWTPVNTGLTHLDVFALTISSNGYIFAGTYLGGVFRSTNNGANWTPVNNGLPNKSIQSLFVNSSGHIFAGIANDLFISTDNGASWTSVSTGLAGAWVKAIAINASGHIFAASRVGFTGVFRSMDNGRSWTRVINGLTNTNTRSLTINASGHIFVGTEGGGIFRSIDNGNTWSPINAGLAHTHVYIMVLVTNSSGHLFAGTDSDGIFKSTDNGSNWAPINAGLTNTFVHALLFNANGHIFAGTGEGGGIFRSTNSGGSWNATNTGLTNTRVLSLAANLSGHVFAGTWNGVFRTTDNGDSWASVNTGLTNTRVLSLVVNSNGNIFAGLDGSGIFRSTNSGGSWTRIYLGGPNASAFVINTSGHIFAGTNNGGVLRSTDNGNNWVAVNNGLTNTRVLSLAINSSGYLFAGTDGSGVFRSTDNGSNWISVGADLTNQVISALTINATTQDIFAGTLNNGVFRSTDNGNTWTPANNGLTSKLVQTLAINANGHVFVGTANGGVFRSTDNGGSWASLNTGFMNSDVRTLVVNSSGYIFAGTFGSGAFRSVQPTLSNVVKMISPKGGERWLGDEIYNVEWTTQGAIIDHVALYYSTDGGNTYPNLITINTPNDGLYSWKVPNILNQRVRVKIQILDNQSNILNEDVTGSDVQIARTLKTSFRFGNNTHGGDNYSFSNDIPFRDQLLKPIEYVLNSSEFSQWTKLYAWAYAFTLFFSFNGSCMGMSMSSELYFRNPNEIPVPGKTTYELTLYEATPRIISLQREFFWAALLPILKTQLGIPSSYLFYWSYLEEQFQKNDVAVIALTRALNTYGHAVVAYKLADFGDERRIYIYDVNYPKKEDIYLNLTKQANGVLTFDGYQLGELFFERFEAVIWPVKPSDVIDLFLNWLSQKVSALFSNNKHLLMFGSPGYLLIQDNFGRKVGTFNGASINEIPGALVLSNFLGEAYELPADLSYAVTIVGLADGQASFGGLFTRKAKRNEIQSLGFRNFSLAKDAKAIFHVSPSSIDSALQMDLNNDGTFELSLPPNNDTTFSISQPAAPENLAAIQKTKKLVHLVWDDHSTDELGFAIERSVDSDKQFVVIGSVPENMTGFADSTFVPQKTNYYRVAAFNAGGKSVYSNIAKIDVPVEVFDRNSFAIPNIFSLSQNYPNPFNPETAIEFALPKPEYVKLHIFTMNGQEVRLLISEPMKEGVHTAKWDGRDNHGIGVGSGVYFVRIQAGELTKTMKILMLQ